MKIEIVQLENIRSHLKSTVPFTKGFNCLVGGLGCGKSSVLYAIDFALFGEPIGRSFEYLLREDADSGKVTVQFSQNGNTYKITRGLKRRAKGISQDFDVLRLFQEETLLASMKTDAVTEQFKTITGLDGDLYREIIWVRQERLKELLDSAPRERQKRLDDLFGLSDYETAWSSMAEYQREYETEKRVYEKDPDVIGLKKLGSEYSQITEEFTLLEIELQFAVEKVARARRAMEDADELLKKLEEKRLTAEHLKRRETHVQTNITNTKEALTSLTKRVEGKRAIIDNLKQRQVSMETQVKACNKVFEDAGILTNQSVEAFGQHIVALDDQISNLRGEQEATLRNMHIDQKRTASLSMENRCPLCLQQLNDEYKTSLIQRIEDESRDRQKFILQLKGEIEALQKTKRVVSEAFSQLQTLVVRTEEVRVRIVEEEKNLSDLSTESEEKQRSLGDLQRQIETLSYEISRFELADFEAAKERSRQAFQQYSHLESDLRFRESRKKDLLMRLDETKERIDNAQQKVERMQRIFKIVEILGGIRDAYRSIQPKLRSEFVKVLRNFVQQVLDSLVGGEAPLLNVLIDETYTPYVKSESGVEREVANLSGGERTLLAFAYRLGLGQLIMQSRTSHGLSMLLLDEPTESLGSEDGSIDRLAEAISRFKAIEQIIAVTHSEAFAEKAEHVITLEKEAGISKVSIER
jgi:DNA repair protein SbcC/Rad50